MAENNNRNQNDAGGPNATNAVDGNSAETVATVGTGVVGAIVGSFFGPLGTIAGAVAGAALGNQAGAGVDNYAQNVRGAGGNK
ncbi:hypothetical protein PP175_01430 [Aneurinibacillus sp. Ricciae_BoGa-3]|uniref:hypothetical protein n=1 Tax=Aneurinibacillus sp. Ricciae_BoGa-3 TaxID=3022697 RepID=UPI002340B5B4|nr:hypothetical protein [Aneurinibacillus sp. Ricciae_BoGa-3]WCK54729.1 hypothetical protein PP175_01430 [Aneurinibacillus sp. Ricciae_BoGa-3]